MALKTPFLILHVLGVVFGVGGVLMLDVHLLRHLRGARILPQDVRFTQFVSLFVKVGLILVWASGIVIIAIAPDGPAAVLANPKLQAKLVVVVVLTVNALFVETLALPLVHGNVGRPLFHGVDQVRRTVILGCAAISTLSWTYPVALGLAREFNGVVPAQVILTDYVILLACLAVGMQVSGRVLYRPRIDIATPTFAASFPAGIARGLANEGTSDVNRMFDVEVVHRRDVGTATPTLSRPSLDVRQAGREALGASVTPAQVVSEFAAFVSEGERQLYRAGLFEALRGRVGVGRGAEDLLEVVAADEALRCKFAIVAPDATARDAFLSTVEQARQRAEDRVWAKVREWHASMVALNAGEVVAAAHGEVHQSAMAG